MRCNNGCILKVWMLRILGVFITLMFNILNHVNIIAGDNNSGKTSILGALHFFINPNDLNNVLKIARMRDLGISNSNVSLYENFINLFPKDDC